MLFHLYLLFPLKVPFEHMAYDFIWICRLRDVWWLAIFESTNFLFIAFKDIEAYVGSLRRRVKILLFVDWVYFLISFESLLLSFEMFVAIWRHIRRRFSITKAFDGLRYLFFYRQMVLASHIAVLIVKNKIKDLKRQPKGSTLSF